MQSDDIWEEEGIGIEHIVAPQQPRPVRSTPVRPVVQPSVVQPDIDTSNRITRGRPTGPTGPTSDRRRPISESVIETPRRDIEQDEQPIRSDTERYRGRRSTLRTQQSGRPTGPTEERRRPTGSIKTPTGRISESVIDTSTTTTRSRPMPARRRFERRPNVLERRSEQLSTLVPEKSKPAPRINRYIAPDNTSLDIKMNVGFDIPKKTARDSRPVQVEDPNWFQRIDYTKLFTGVDSGGYSVGDIRTLVNKTQLVNVTRSIWDRNRLLSILIDYLVDRGLYEQVKELSNMNNNWIHDIIGACQECGDICDQCMDRRLQDALADHYQDNRLWEVLERSLLVRQMRQEVQRTPNISDYYESRLINEERNRALINQLGEQIFGDVLYVDSIGNTNLIDFLPTDLTSITTADTNNIDQVSGRFNMIILDHVLDLYPNDRGELINKLKKMLRPNGRLIIISYDYGYNASNRMLRDPVIAFKIFNSKLLIDDYMIPDTPHIDISSIKMDYPDEPQILSWMGSEPREEFIISQEHDPIVELVRVY